MTPSALHNELTADPLGLGYAALITSGSDGGLAALLNAKNYTLSTYLPISALQSYVDSHGLRDGIESAFDTNPAARAACRLFTARYETVDVTTVAFLTAMGGLVQSGLMTAADQTAILALAVVPASRAEVLGGLGTTVSGDDVSQSFGRL